MAISGSTLGSQADTTNQASYSTSAAFTPTANALVLAAVVNNRVGGATTPTGSGNSLTYVSVGSQSFTSGQYLLTVFRALGASPTNGVFTADFGGTNQTGCAISVVQFTGVDTSGTNGSGAVVQFKVNTGTATTPFTVTLDPFGSVNNGAYVAFGASGTGGITHKTGWTELHDVSYTIPSTGLETQWIATNDTACEGTPTAGLDFGGLAIEIKAAAAAGVAGTTLRSRIFGGFPILGD